MDWTVLENRLAQAIGLDTASLGKSVFRQAVDRRRQACQSSSLSAYIRVVDADVAELQALIEDLVVKESWFFRHAQSFAVLCQHAVATMARRQEAYRVLSIPCAAGEEPYSIVMALCEAGLSHEQFQVDAADISEAALQKARAGTFGLRSIRNVPPAIQHRYFVVTQNSVQVLPEIIQAVRITQANIIETPFLPGAAAYDAIFCRNLLIYLTTAARQQVLRNLDRLIAPGGLLFVGHAEMNQELDARFEALEHRGAFAYRRRVAAAPIYLPQTSSSPLTRSETNTPAVAGSAQIATRNDAATSAKPRRPSSRQMNPRVSHASQNDQSSRDDLVQRASELCNSLRYPEAIEICEQDLQRNGPSPQVYHMLGMVFQAAGFHEKAVSSLERAVYLDPHHEEALLALALLARRSGNVQVADRYQQRSLRANDRSARS